MQLTETDVEDYTVIAPDGRLTAAVTGQFRSTVDATIARGRSRIVVSLQKIPFIDSSGLGALVGALKSARVAGGDLRICEAPDQVRQVLRLTNLDRVLTVYESPQEAFRGE